MAIVTIDRRVATAAGALLACAALTLPAGTHADTTPPAPKAPSVYTGASPSLSTTLVTFKGSVNPHGLATVYAFQFGTTTGYGAQTALASAGNGTTSTSVGQTMKGLQPGITYHYRLVATNAAGTTNGQDVAFLIKAPLKLQIVARPDPDPFGSPFTVSGVLSGTGAANHQVVLLSNPFPFLRGFKNAAGPVLTDAGGNFSFSLAHLMENTQFRVATVEAMPISSNIVIERVATRVSLHVRSSGRPGFVRMYGTVAPAEAGKRVLFQLMRPGARPLTVASAKAKRTGASTSRYSAVVRIRHRGMYRAFVGVASGKQISGHSRQLLIR